MLRILHDTKYDFIKYWRHAAIATIAFIVVGLTVLAFRGFNPSIEFTGGTLMEVHFAKPPSADAVRGTVDAAGFPGSEIAQFGPSTDFTIRARARGAQSAAGTSDTTVKQIERALHAKFGDTTQVKVERAEFIGGRVGEELKRNAIIAILISFLVTLIYLAVRFEWRFGVAAVAATAHDLLTTLAFLAMMRLEFSLTVVAGLLTVIGCSLNDTIIIFDPVRETLKRQRKESLRDVLNRSINETLPRSVLTHTTALAATLALLFFAGEVIRPFSWIMAFGIITGTFSSVYVAGALLLWIENKWPRTPEGQGGAATAATAARRQKAEARS